jgi:polysaccharide pyruvyl transferase WcaK-like protein
MKKIFIVGAQPGGNKGAEAMLETVLLSISELVKEGDIEVYVEALNTVEAYDIFKSRISVNFNYFLFSPKKILEPYAVSVKKGDTVIDIGGINYHDRSLKANIRSLIRHRYFLSKGAKLVFFTQDHGPCRKFVSKNIAKYVYGQASRIFMRSRASEMFLRNLSPKANIEGVFPDCTLMLEKSDAPLISDDYFVLSPSAIMYNLYGDEYINAFVAFVETLAHNYKPVIVCHNFTPNGNSSDLEVCNTLYKAVAKYNPLYFKDEMTPSEYKGIFSKAKFCISSRYHVIVGSFSVGVPAIAIGWNHKYDEFLGLYDKKSLNMEYSKDLVANVLEEISKLERNGFYNDEIKNYNLDFKKSVQNSFNKLKLIIE